jgi:TolB-like protein
MALDPSTALAAPAVREQLRRILASPVFACSERMKRLLGFTVESVLAGKAAELKETVLGLEVYDRPASYDARIDPVVRVEARRLREKLRQYYASEGRTDPVLVELPVGAYVPRFRTRSSPHDEPSGQDHRIAVLPLTDLSPAVENDFFSDGLTEEIIHTLTNFEGLCVVAWQSASQLKNGSLDLREAAARLRVGSILKGSVRRAGNRVRIAVQLIDAATSQYLWSETFDR